MNLYKYIFNYFFQNSTLIMISVVKKRNYLFNEYSKCNYIFNESNKFINFENVFKLFDMS